jgi:Rrf2 family protein
MAANSRFAMATHIMTALAIGQEKITSSMLASSINTNPVVVRRILSELQKAGLVSTESGRNGGALLSKPAGHITLYDVYAAVDEGTLFAYNPNDPNKTCSLSCKMKSVLTPVFQAANSALADKLKKIKLSDLVEEVDTS